MEDGEPEREIRRAIKVALAEYYEKRDLLDTVRTEIREFNAVEIQEFAEEERSRERKPAIKKGKENDELAATRLGRFLIAGDPPSILLGLRDHSLGYVREEQRGGHLRSRPGALACH